MDFSGVVQTLFSKKSTSLLQKHSMPIAETQFYNMSTAVSESQGISNEQFRINRVREVVPDYDPVAIISASEAKIPSAKQEEYTTWRKSLNMDGMDYDYAAAFRAGLSKDTKTGHLEDTYKLPHHSTFPKHSVYAKGKYKSLAGSWKAPSVEGAEWSYTEGTGFKASIKELYDKAPAQYKKNYFDKI